MLCLYNYQTNFIFKSIIGLNQIFGGELLFYRLNFENIKIIIYIYIYIYKQFKIWGEAMAPPLHIATPLALLMLIKKEKRKFLKEQIFRTKNFGSHY